MTLKSETADGTVIEEKPDIEYTIGSELLGCLGKACDKALTGMRKGEEATLKCSKDYAYDDKPEGATVTLTWKELYETKDVSFQKDKSVMKKQVKEGEGYETPKDGGKVKLNVETATDGTTALAGFTAKVLEFTVGNGEVCDALECAIAEMKKGEKAILTVTDASQAKEAQLGLKDVTASKIVFTMELPEFEKAKDTWSMSEEEKVEFGTARKEVGTSLLKSGRVAMALQRYKKVADIFGYIDNFKEENKEKAKDLKKACALNQAMCYLKLNDYIEAKKSCDTVLKDDKVNVKAMFRHAQAELGLKNYIECISDCKKVIDLEPQNKDVRNLLKQAQAGQKEVDKQAKGMFANMCKALGKGSKRPHDGEGDTTAPDKEKPADEVAPNDTAMTEADPESGKDAAPAGA